MDTTLKFALILAVGLLIGAMIAYIRGEIRSLQDQIKELKNLPKRHTYRTTAGLEDAIAVLLDIQYKRDAESKRVGQALEILHQLRQGPQNYQTDRPAGRRPERWDDNG